MAEKIFLKAGFLAGLGGFSHSTIGKSFIGQIGWEETPHQIITVIILFSASLVLFLIALSLRTRAKLKREQSNLSARLFDDYAAKCGLHPAEKKRLQQLLTRAAAASHPAAIFQSCALFEQCIDAEVRLLLLTKSNPEFLKDDETALSGLRRKLGYGYLPLEHPLCSTRNIETGQVVTVFTATGDTPLIQQAVIVENRETFFRLHYDSVNDDARILNGQEVKCIFTRQNDGIYGVQVEVCRIASPLSFDCLHTLRFRRNQMRQYVRTDVNLPMRVRVVPQQRMKAVEPFPCHINARLSDISGGGLSFLYENSLAPGDTVALQFSLTTGKFTGITGKILRISMHEATTGNRYRHHVQFISIEQPLRDRIVKFIFEEQRRQNQVR